MINLSHHLTADKRTLLGYQLPRPSTQLHLDSFIDFPPLSSTPIQFDTSKCSTPNSQFSPVDSSSTNIPTYPPTAPSSKPFISDSVHVVSDTENDTNIPVSDSLNSVNKSIVIISRRIFGIFKYHVFVYFGI
jgi:hypothetical protein